MSDHHLIDQATTHTGEIIYGTIYAIIHVIFCTGFNDQGIIHTGENGSYVLFLLLYIGQDQSCNQVYGKS